MSGLILCRTKEAVNPYYISGMDIKIYSLEELCYYIYNNVYLIGTDFICPKLIEFIRSETKEPKLADRLEYLGEKKAGLAEMVLTVLRYVDYYTDDEIEKLRGILTTLNTQNVYERLKTRADRLMLNECYYAAIRSYSQIINGKKIRRFLWYFTPMYAITWGLHMQGCFCSGRHRIVLMKHIH